MWKTVLMWLRFAHVAAFAALAVNTVAQAAPDRRVALVIGNSGYQNAAPLDNPIADSKAMAASLKRLGFEVVEGYDLKVDQMRDVIGDYSTRLEGAKVALVYYAGHGVSVSGENYLLPVDIVLKREADLDLRAINISLVMRQMQREDRANVVILDACRNNPFATDLARSLNKTRSALVASGLSEMNAQSAAGTLIAFSTDPGQTAFDGRKGENSPFASALLRNVETPGLSISAVMDRVREDVWTVTERKQRPWVNTSIIGELFLAGAQARPPLQVAAIDPDAAITGRPNVAPGAPPWPALSPSGANHDLELSLWAAAQKSDTPEDYRAYLDSHPNGYFAQMAKNRIARLTGNLQARPLVDEAVLKAEAGTARTEADAAFLPQDRNEAHRRLKAIGFDPGRAGTTFTSASRNAIARWQASRTVPETGYFTKTQRLALWSQSEPEYQRSIESAPRALQRVAVARPARPVRHRGKVPRQPEQGINPIGAALFGLAAGTLIGRIRR